ncbi:T9SS type A sorting domain-containing protein, partial [candidate division KSB1 bacterium]|nr:T9SS type A sorting domain-containing protein [candidate division KSB1 bacterium]
LGQANGITIEWQTALEIDIAGYNLYHSVAENGEYSKMNEKMITASGKSDGSAYSFSYRPDHDGLHYFKLEHVGLDGKCEFNGPISASFVTGVTVATSEIPQEFSLAQNYPNPFNPSTSIAFALPTQEFVTITIFDGRGRVVKSLMSRNMPAGSFVVTWDGTNEEGSQIANGIYFYRFVAGDFSKTLKMTFMK